MRLSPHLLRMPSPDALPLIPIQRQNLADLVTTKLRSVIANGELQPGSALSEPDLAQRLGVSRSPIREALIQLEREGLVRFDDKGRTRICSMTPADFSEISSMRVALESLGARWVADRWNPELTRAIKESIKAQSEATSLKELSQLDVEMHEMIMRAAGHQRLLAAWLIIRPQFEMWLAHIHRQQDTNSLKPRQITVTAHRRLLAALSSGCRATAAKEMADHIESWAEWLPIAYQTALAWQK